MHNPIYQKQPWLPFIYEGKAYTLKHLDEFQFKVTDSSNTMRIIVVNFSDHCFTRERRPGEIESEALEVGASSRNPGYFCFDRYQHSLGLRGYLSGLSKPRSVVWNVQGGNYAVVPSVDHNGTLTFYGIIFSLDRVSGLKVDLRMDVRTAYPCDERKVETFGSVRFEHLVRLRVEGKRKRPKPILDSRRKQPSLS
jgi:hypothetical protein